MSCNWIRDNNGNIIGATTPEGVKSQLFQDLESTFGLDKAVDMYAVSQSDDFQDIFADSQPKKEALIRYISEQNENKEPLTDSQKVDLQNLILSVGEYNPKKLINLFFNSEGLFEIDSKKLISSGYYSQYEALKIADDIDLQNDIKNALEALKNNQETLSLVDYKIEKPHKINEFTSFGKMKVLNPSVISKELIQELGGLSKTDFENKLQEFTFKDITFEESSQYVEAEVLIEKDEELVNDLVDNTEVLIEQTAKLTDNQKFIDSLETSSITKEYEQAVLNNLGIDITGFSDMLFDAKLVIALQEFAKSPNKQNTEILVQEYDRVFKKNISPRKEKIKGNKDLKNHVKVENTTKTEEQLFQENSLLKTGENTYVRIVQKPLEELYRDVSTHFKEIKDLKEYVQDKIKNSEFVNAENAEANYLYKMYFGLLGGNVKGGLLSPNRKFSKDEKLNLFLNGLNNIKGLQANPFNSKEYIYGNNLVNLEINRFDKQDKNEIALQDISAIEKGKGSAKAAMNDIISVADSLNYKITLDAKPFGDDSNRLEIRDLVNFYKSFGFKVDLSVFDSEFKSDEEYIQYVEENPSEAVSMFRDAISKSKPLDIKEITVKKAKGDRGDFDGEYDVLDKNNNILGSLYWNTDKTWRDPNYKQSNVYDVYGDILGYNKKEATEEVVKRHNEKSSANFQSQIKNETEIDDIRFLKSLPQTKKLQNFKGNYEYLTKDFVSDFYVNWVKEKNKDSDKWKNYYSNFTINQRGLYLINDDALSLQNIKIYADENLRQYSLLSKQLPDLSEVKEVEYDTQSKRDEAVNYPENVKNFNGQLYKISSKEIILKNTTDEFLKVGRDIYEIVETQGELSHYVKLDKNNTEYNIFGAKQTKTENKISNYSHLNEKPTKFTTVKNYLTKEEKDNLEEDFNC